MLVPKEAVNENQQQTQARLKWDSGCLRGGAVSTQSLNSKLATNFQEEFKKGRLCYEMFSGSVNSKGGPGSNSRTGTGTQPTPLKSELERTPNFVSESKRPILKIDFSCIEKVPSLSSGSLKASNRTGTTGSEGLFAKKNSGEATFSEVRSDLLCCSERKLSEIDSSRVPTSREFKMPAEAPPCFSKLSLNTLVEVPESENRQNLKAKSGSKRNCANKNDFSLLSEEERDPNLSSNEEASFASDVIDGSGKGSLLLKFLQQNPEFKNQFYEFIVTERAEQLEEAPIEEEDDYQKRKGCIKSSGSALKKNVQFQRGDSARHDALTEQEIRMLRSKLLGSNRGALESGNEGVVGQFDASGKKSNMKLLLQRQRSDLEELTEERDEAVRRTEDLEVRNAELTKLLSKLTLRSKAQGNEHKRQGDGSEGQARLSSDSNSSQVQMKFLANLNEESLKKYKDILKKVKGTLRVRNKGEIVNCVEELTRRAKWQKKLIKNLWKILQISTVGEDSSFGISRKLEIEEARGVEIEAKVRALIEQNKILRRNAAALSKKEATASCQSGSSQPGQGQFSLEKEEAKQRESFSLEERLQRIKTILDK